MKLQTMGDDAFDVPGFLATRFPPLAWPQIALQAVFYHWPVALPFDLGGRKNFAVVQQRASELYQAAFGPEEFCIIAGGRFVPKAYDGSIEAPGLFDPGDRLGLRLGDRPQRHAVDNETGGPERDRNRDRNDDEDDEGTWLLQWV